MNWNVVLEASRMEPFVTRRIIGEVTDEAVLHELREALAKLAG